jgi:hypothetical protein
VTLANTPLVLAENDGKRQAKITAGTWYTAKVLVGDDGSGGDRLRFWVDGDGTGSDETTLIETPRTSTVRGAPAMSACSPARPPRRRRRSSTT